MENQKAITLNYAVESYLNHLADLNKKEATISVYRRSLDIALLYFGTEKDIAGITLPQTGKFFKSDQVNKHPNGKPKAAPTVKQIKRVFRQCLTFCKEQNWIAVLPVPKGELEHARSNKQPLSQSKNNIDTPEAEAADKTEDPGHEEKVDSQN